MAIQVISPDTSRQREQLAMLQLAAQGAKGFAGYQAIQRQQLERAALVDALAGQPGALGPGGMGPPTAGTPGLLPPGMNRQQIEALVLGGGGDALLSAGLARQFPKPGEGFSLSPGQVRFDAGGNQVAVAPADATKPPETRNVLVGNERVFQQFDPATGQWTEVGRGPAFAPAASTTVNNITGPAATIASMAPGAISDLSGISNQLVSPDGTVNTQLLATMNVPGLNAAVPGTAGAQMRSAMEGAMDTMVRIRTGAAASEQELAQMREIYMPSLLDTAGTVKSKIDRLKRDLNAALGVATQGKNVPGAARQAAPSAPAEPGIVDQLIGQGMDFLRGPSAATTATVPQVGAIEDGYRFKGGDASDPNSWEAVR